MVQWYVWTRVIFVSMGGFLYGYDIGFMNGVKDMVGYREALNLSYSLPDNTSASCSSQDDVETSAILGLIVSLLSIGAVFGALAAGTMSDTLGRKPTIIIGASLAALGGMLHTAAIHLGMVIVGRLIGGIGVGFLFQVTPLYVAEISPEKSRGRLLSVLVLTITTAYVIGTVVNIGVKELLYGWRISVSIQFLVAAVLGMGMFLLPRSPRFLVKCHQEDKAEEILYRMYGSKSKASSQLAEIRSAVSSTSSLKQALAYMLQWKILQRLLIVYALIFFGRLSGATFVTYFSVSLFCGIGLPGFVVVIVICICSLISTAISISVIDKLGRKPIFLISLLLMCTSLTVSAIIIIVFDLEDSTVFSVSQTVAGYFVVAAVSLFYSCVVISVGKIPWIIMGEIFPLQAKGFMTSICSTGFWIGTIVVGQMSSVLINSPIKIFGTLLLFALVCFLLFLFVLLLLPETKGVPLEQMEELLSKPWLERTNVWYYLRCGCFLEQLCRGRRRRRKTETEDREQLTGSRDQLGSSSSSTSTTCTSDVPGLEEESAQLGKEYCKTPVQDVQDVELVAYPVQDVQDVELVAYPEQEVDSSMAI